jgi:hypothetical protein
MTAVPPTPTFCPYGITLAASSHSHYPELLQPTGKVPIPAFTANGKFATCLRLPGGKTV